MISLSKVRVNNKLLIFLLFGLFFILRLYRLGYHDFWYDEVGSVGYAQYPWGNWNAPLYFIMLHFWIKLGGISEFSLRFPSLLFSFFSIVIVFLLGKGIFNKKTAVFAAILMGLSPFHLWYAQEARDYSMVLFFGTLSSYLFFLAIKKSNLTRWLLFTLVSLIGLYTNYFYIFLFLSQFLYVLYMVRLRLNRAYLPFLFVALSFSFYLPRFLSKFWTVAKGFWIFKPSWEAMPIVLGNYILGYNGTAFLYAFSFFIFIILFISLLLSLHKKGEITQGISFCIFLFFIPICLVFLFSKLFFSVYLNRGLLLFSPYFYLIIAYAVMRLRKNLKIALSSVLLLIICSGIYLYFHEYMYPPLEYHVGTYLKKPIRPIVSFLNNNVEEGDLIAYTNDSMTPSIDFYNKKKYSYTCYLFSPEIWDTNWQRPIRENEYYIPIHKIDGLKFKQRLWVISTDWARNVELNKNAIAAKKELDANFKLTFIHEFDGLWIFRYEKSG